MSNATEFADFFRKRREQETTATAASALVGAPSQTSAIESLEIGRTLGVDPEAVLGSEETFRDQSRLHRAMSDIDRAPRTQAWISSRLNAAIAQDDLANLSALERMFAMFRRGDAEARVRGMEFGRDLSASAETGRIGQIFAMIGEQADESLLSKGDGQPNFLGRLANMARQSAMDRGGVPRSLIGGEVVSPEERRDFLTEQGLGPMYEGAKGVIESLDARGITPLSVSDVQSFGDALTFVSDNLFASAPQMAVTIASGGVAPVTNAILLGGEANAELAERTDLTLENRVRVASGAGVAMAALDLFGLSRVLGVGGAGQLATESLDGLLADRMIAKGVTEGAARVLEAAIVEGTTEALQEGIVVAITAASGGQYSAEEVQERLLNALAAGAGTGGSIRTTGEVTSGAARLLGGMDRYARAGSTDQALADLDATAGASQVRQQAPNQFADAMRALGGEEQAVYVPADGLRTLFQAKDLDDNGVFALGLDPRQIEELSAAGDDVAIPLSVLASQIAGTEDMAWFRANAKFDPDEMSMADAEAFEQSVGAIMQDAFEEAEAEREADEAARASDSQVEDAMFRQLRAAGQGPDAATYGARLWSSFWRTMGERYGEDPLDLARQFGVRVQGPQEALGRPRGEVDVMLNTLRKQGAQALAPRGKSLTEFVISEGGIQDRGGDIAATDPAKGVIAETADEVRARTSEPTLDGLPREGRGALIEDMAERAFDAGYFTGDVRQDGARQLIDALAAEARGEMLFRDGEGPDMALSEVAEALSQLGVDLSEVSNDQAVAALENGGRSLSQRNEAKSWKTGIDRMESGRAATTDDARISLGPVLSAFLPNRAVVLRAGPARSIVSKHKEITWDVLRALPARLQDPEFVLRSGTRQGSIVVVPIEIEGKPMVVAINTEGKDRNGKIANEISSVYFKEGDGWLDNEARSGRLIYDRDGGRAGGSANRSRSNSASVRPEADLAPPRRGKILTRADLFKDKSFEQQSRGLIQFPIEGIGNGETVIRLTESADLSTFLHESGHFFLEAMQALADADVAPDGLKADMAAIREFLGAAGGEAFTTEQHETWARGFEAYLMEGKAPSLALADAFSRFKAWLVRIYRSIAGLNVDLPGEVREVMDRMLATDREIAEVRAVQEMSPLFAEAPPGMSSSDFQAYQRMAQRSQEEAEARLLKRTLEKVRREREAWYKAEKRAVREEVAGEYDRRPEYRLIEMMANQRWTGSDEDAPDVRLDRQTLVDQFGEGIIAELSRQRLGGKRAIYGLDGMSTEEAAETFGFEGAVQMVRTLQNTRKKSDAVAQEVERRMVERHGDPLNDGTIEEEALAVIHGEQQMNTSVTEARHIARQLGRDTATMRPKVYRQRARMMIGRMSVRDAMRSRGFLAAERKASRAAQDAFAKIALGSGGQDALAAALQAKEQQILNGYLFDEAKKIEAEVRRGRERMRSYDKRNVREKVGAGYIEQIDALIEGYEFRQRSGPAAARTETLAAFADRMIAEGREAELAIDEALLSEARRVHYSRMTVESFRGLVDTVKNIDHMGRFKEKLRSKQKARELSVAVDRVVENVRTNIGTGRAKQESKLRSAINLIWTTDTILTEIDGLDEFGPAYQEVKEAIDAGQTREQELSVDLADRLDEVFAVYSGKEIAAMQRRQEIDGRLWSKSQILSVALNTGNDDNLQRLLSDKSHESVRLDQGQLDRLLDTLDERDWSFVQSMWDLIDSYWPEIVAVEERRTGVRPKKVETKPVPTKYGLLRGGYYPIKYDPGLSAMASEDEASAFDRFISAGRFGKAQTANGHTKSRQNTGGARSLHLDMSVAFGHMRDVVRSIALSEAVDDAHRVLNHQRTKDAFIDAGRTNDHRVLNLWLKDLAKGPIYNADIINSVARTVKNNFTLSRLGFNLRTVILQATGLGQSAATVGKRRMLRALIEYRKRPAGLAREVLEKSAFMSERQSTFQKDIYDFANDVKIASPLASRWSKVKDRVSKAGFMPIVKMQFWSVDMPTWLAGYDAGLERFDGDEARAIQYADRMVARAQDSGLMGDRNAVSRGTVSETVRQSDFIKLFTTLAGYMMAKMNRANIVAQRGIKGVREADTPAEAGAAAIGAATDLMLLYVFEAAFMALLYSLLTDDEDEDDIRRFMIRETASAAVGGIPFARDAASAFAGYGSGGVYGSVLDVPSRVWRQIEQGENDPALRKSIADAVGVATGLPSTASMRLIEGVVGEGGSIAEAALGTNPLLR